MLPVRLTLRNFLPYRAPDPVVFAGLHLACLSGPNGAGKSSLLDAITWALWGKARAHRDEELITLGADEMSVELDFEHEGRLYRVVRQRDRRRRQGRLGFFVRDEGATGGFREIGSASIRETQARIDALLRLDYDTFVHSAFLQQGRADAFTVKTPAQRKQILADILGLEAWSVYEERARRHLREVETALGNVEGRLAQIEEDLAHEPAFRRDLAEAEAGFAEAERALHDAEARYQDVADAPARLRAASDRLADLERRLREYEGDEQAVLADLDRQQARIEGYEAVIARRESIEAGYQALEAARQADHSLSDRLLDLQDVEARRHALEAHIAAARAALEAQAGDHRGAIEELERLAADADDLAADLAAVEDSLRALEALEAERDRLRESIAALNAEAAALRSANQALFAEMSALRARLDALQAAPPESAVCPTCQQPLSPQQRADLIAQYQEQGTARGDHYRANAARLEEIRAELEACESRIAALAPDLRQLPPLRERLGQLRARQEAARAAATRLTEARAALGSVTAALEAESYAVEARAQLAALNAEAARLGYDRAAHTAARETLDSYRAYEARQQELQLALDSLPEARQALQAAHNRLERLRHARQEDSRAHQAVAEEMERLRALVAEANRRADEVRQRRTALQVAAEKRARAQQALGALDGLRQRRQSLLQRRQELLDRQEVYQQLRQAFGKNGIPAMIIEAAIPELEDAANALLARMTDGPLQVRFSTQREKVTGGLAETLDIAIADEAGLRDYALYSGGEAFRIDFAIRIALSKLLAQRAGARLRTLFIDEGFGTQDAAGRERLVEAINAIADDFDLILVITHVEDLRDAFPARLEVEKTPSGSRVRVTG